VIEIIKENLIRHTSLRGGAESGSERIPEMCGGVSERTGIIIIPYGSKILRILLRRASNDQNFQRESTQIEITVYKARNFMC
jgi:hypothetical protein